jgi:hypothetical protein
MEEGMKRTLLIVLLLICSLGFAETHVPQGAVEGTWDVAGSPYLIEGDIVCYSQLTIEPGVIIEFQGLYNFKIGVAGLAQLHAVGTAQDSIIFCAADPDVGWGGLSFATYQVSSDSSHLHYCKIENARTTDTGLGGAVYCFNYPTLSMSHVTVTGTVSDVAGAAVYLDHSSSHMSNITITNALNGGIYSSNSSLILENATIHNIVGDGLKLHFDEESVFHCVIHGSTISNAQNGVFLDAPEYQSYSFSVELVGCDIFDNQNGVTGGYFYRPITLRDCNVYGNDNGIVGNNTYTVENCKIVNNGIAVPEAHYIKMKNTLVANNINGVLCPSSWDGHITLANCVIANNSERGFMVDLLEPWNSTMYVRLCNTISQGNGISDVECNSQWGEVNYCNFDNTSIYSPLVSNCMNHDPLFVMPTQGLGPDYNALDADWSLNDGSVCINAGIPDTTGLFLPSTDLAGNPRVYQGMNPRIDMGVYEFQGEVNVPYIDVDTLDIHCGYYSPNQQSAPQSFTITNVGGSPLEIPCISTPYRTLIDLNGSGQYVQSISDIVLGCYEAATIGVVMQSPEPFVLNDSITISSNAINYPSISVHVQGVVDNSLHVVQDISANTLWDADQVIVHNDITVSQYCTLTIAPGTVVSFMTDAEFTVNGGLIALGTPDQPICFTSSSNWDGLKAYYHQHPIELSNCVIENIRLFDESVPLIMQDYPDLVIEKCTFRNNVNTIHSSGLMLYNSNAVVRNCSFENNVSHGYEEWWPSWHYTDGWVAALSCYNSNVLIEGCVFTGNVSEDGYEHSSPIINIQASNGGETKIVNTLFYDNSSEWAISADCDVEIVNSTFTATNADINVVNGSLYLANTLLVMDELPYITGYGCPITVEYSCISGGQSAVSSNEPVNWLDGNISDDPLLINPDGGNFHLMDNSPCINSGMPDVSGLALPQYDLDGNPRVFDDRIDIGCYEWQGVSVQQHTVPTPRITLANYPNPFNSSTEIRFQISDIRQIEHAEIEIFNLLGQKVKAIPIHTDELSSRPQWRDLSSSTTWDGTDSNGQPVASGLYLYRLVAGSETLAQSKMMLLK